MYKYRKTMLEALDEVYNYKPKNESSCQYNAYDPNGKNWIKKEEYEKNLEEKVECPECEGKGCDHCDDKGYHTEEMQIDEIRTPYVVVDTANNNEVIGTTSDEMDAKLMIASAERPPISIKDKKTLKIVKSRKKQTIGLPLKEEIITEEKAESEAQQKLMGMAYALKKGELDPADVSDKVKELADKMSLKDLKDFASTKHDKLPKKVEGVTDASTADVIGKYFGDEDDEEIKKWTKVDTRESTKAYGEYMDKIASEERWKMLTPSEKKNLQKLADLMAKEIESAEKRDKRNSRRSRNEEIEPSTRGDDLKALKDAQLQKRLTQAQAQVAKWQEVVQRITNIQNVKKEQEK